MSETPLTEVETEVTKVKSFWLRYEIYVIAVGAAMAVKFVVWLL